MKSHILLGVSGFALAALPALAQTAEPVATPAPVAAAAAEAADPSNEYILVTGSRIARPNLDSTVPIVTLSVGELTKTGEVSLGDTINLLPAFRPTFSTQNSGRFIGTAGLNTLDLRGQGTARTLVLQNGRRHVTSDPGSNTVDVNTIPTDLVERVDVVTGGNSAIYGSDAIAGVVNFVMKRDFEGLRARGQMGLSYKGDRPTYFGSLTWGKNFKDGRGNIAVNAEYSEQAPLFFTERDSFAGGFSGRTQFQLTENTTYSGPDNRPEPAEGNGISDTTLTSGIKNAGISLGGAYSSACTGSAARRAVNCSGVFSPTSRNPTTGAINFTELGNVFVFQPDGTLVKNVGTQDFRPFGSGNFQGGLGSTLRETGLLQVGVTRYAGNVLGSYEFSDAARFFFEGKYVKVESIQEGQPTFSSGLLSPAFSINNPFLTTQARDLLVQSLAPGATTFTTSRFNVDFGGRGENHSRELYRIVAGLDGTFLDTWRYEAFVNYGRVETFYETRGNVAQQRFVNAANAVRNSAGQIVCGINADANTTNDDPACVPINLFGQGNPSPEALSYIVHRTTRDQWSDQFNAGAFVSGDLGKLFTLPGGAIGFSVGGEYRSEGSFSAYDPFTNSTTNGQSNTFLNLIADFDPPRLNIWEGFAEVRVPILADVPFFKELTVEGATRFSNYNVGSTGTVWSFNVGGIWSPVEDVRLRASWARAIRAPTASNLFSAQSQTFLNGLVDPCAQGNILANPNRVANCAAAGVPTTQTFTVGGVTSTEPFSNVPNSGISGFNGGNPDLSEEKSTSWTVGGVIRPRWVPGLILSVDYYDIELEDAINTIAAQTIINQCYDNPDGVDNQFCRALNRNPNGTFAGQSNVRHAGSVVEFPTTGSSFLQGPFNYARQRTKGIDFDLSYTYPSSGDWNFSGRAIVAYLIERNFFTSLTEPDRITQQKFALGDPEWSAQLRLNLGWKTWNLGWNMRYVGKQTVGTFEQQNSVQDRPATNLDAFPVVFYPDVTYHDLRLEKELGEGSNKMVYFGVDNVGNQLPPYDLLGTGAGDSIFTNTGRFYYVGLDVKF